MNLRSSLKDVLSEVSSKVTSFQIELHQIITWIMSSGLFQDHRIFEDMRHGITINRDIEKKNKITYMHLGVWGVLKFLFQMLYTWGCFICGLHELHEFRSEMYHT